MTPSKPPITTSPELVCTRSPRSPGPAPRNSFARPCLPEVHQSSASGASGLLGEAACGAGAACGGPTPRRRRRRAQAWLSSGSMQWAGGLSEGCFQCRLDSGAIWPTCMRSWKPVSLRTSRVVQLVKNLPTMLETWVIFLCRRSKWQPTPVFLPGESHGQRSLAGYCP